MSDPTPHLERFQSYQEACRDFRWVIPERFNIASAICRRHADAVARIALKEVKEAGINTYTFGGLDFLSDKFAMALSQSGINQGEPVAVMLPPSAALAVAHLGVLKTGAVVVPLPIAADADLLEHALADGRTKAVVVDESIYGRAKDYRSLSSIESRFVVRDLRPTSASLDDKDFWTEVDRASSDFEAAHTDPNSMAFIFYIEAGGKPTGVVHSHRSLIGQLSAFEMFMEPEAESVFWTADDWSSPGALLGALYPAWWYGCSFAAGAADDRDSMLRLMERCSVTHALIPSSRLNMLAESELHPRESSELKLLTVVCDGLPWPECRANDDLSVTLNCVYGRPEAGWIFGQCERWFKTDLGSMGRPAPGRSIEVIDESGNVLPPRKAGRIAIHKSDPALFSEFHNAPQSAAMSFVGDWFLTGDIGHKNEDGDLFIHHPLT
jgi:acetyl-CoA synthetase